MSTRQYVIDERRVAEFRVCDICGLEAQNLHVRVCDVCGREVCFDCYGHLSFYESLKDIVLMATPEEGASNFILCDRCLLSDESVHERLASVCKEFETRVQELRQEWARVSLGVKTNASDSETRDQESPEGQSL